MGRIAMLAIGGLGVLAVALLGLLTFYALHRPAYEVLFSNLSARMPPR